MSKAWIRPPFYTDGENRIIYERKTIRVQRLINGEWMTILTSNYRPKIPKGVVRVGRV